MYGYNIFHENQMFSLIKSVQENKNNHAYIFCGEEGIGRHVCAELLAAALVCKNTNQAPCSACPECIRAKAKTHPDISYIKAPKDKKTIGVDQMRSLSDDCFIKPFSTGHKVYILEGDLMTEQAQNAFLKTLEEPPEYAVFIIISSDIKKLLDTVVSRASVVNFPPLSPEKIKSFIKTSYPDEKRIDFLASYAEGNPGKIEKIINDENFEVLRFSSLENLSMLLSDRLYSSYKVSDFLEENKENVSEIFNLWLMFLRDILLISEGMENRIVNTDLKDKLKILSGRCTSKKTAFAIEQLCYANEMLTRFVNLRAISLNLALSIKKMTK